MTLPPLSVNRQGVTRLTLLVATRLVPAAVFIAFGIGKFTNHPSEAHSFALYGLPAPGAFAYAIGVLEIVGGLALLSGVALLFAALGLAGDMVGAIVVSGIGRGENVSLTLAPALLVAMLALVARELRRGGPHRVRPGWWR
jgi:uncharacterized membrane protein YphA (DoxX/SURF4 family)